jgi:adenylosuccinate lyase
VAEPTSFGHKVALWAFELDRDRARLRRAGETIAVGAISGAVGTYAQVHPKVEEEVCARLGLRAAEASNQIVARDRHAELMSALAITGSTLDLVATEIRHLARTEVREVQEPFAHGQMGSSAMPHKRNPVRCERISGLARVIRGNLVAALENTVLWHERDISHSSAERVILPDSTMALDFMLAETTEVLEGLQVHPDRMRENLEVGGGLACPGVGRGRELPRAARGRRGGHRADRSRRGLRRDARAGQPRCRVRPAREDRGRRDRRHDRRSCAGGR